MTIKVVLADDHPIFRDGLVQSLEETDAFEVVGVGGSAQEAVDLVEQHHPDLVVLDVSMPGSGLNAVKKIAIMPDAPKISMLTVSEDDSDVASALQAGALGYVLKGVSAEELRQALASIARGNAHISPGLADRVLKIMTQKTAAKSHDPIDDLTKREEDILRLVAKGQSNREVADALSLQEKTVKHYMTSIMEKLHARNRVEAALIATDKWGRE
jgi:DNA-binding NarL/FixJ family response regulator